MARYLVSGTAALAADVGHALRAQGAEVAEVDDIAAVPQACADAGPGAFDGYVQLPWTFSVEGSSAIERVHHFFADGVLARFPAVAAALPSLVPDARITFVLGVLPPEISTADLVTARTALVRVLGHAARADSPDGLGVSLLSSGSSPEEIALTALGRNPEWEALAAEESSRSYADWRVEVLGLMKAQM